MSVPFQNRVFTFTQPDGSTIQVRGWGDQHHAVFETLDGFTVTKNPANGYFEVARVSADGNALEPSPGPAGHLDAAGAGLAPGLRVSAARAKAIGLESALRNAGRRCEQRWLERRRQLQTVRAIGAAGGPLLAPPQRQTIGDFVGLCLLIDFSDAPATIPREEVDRFCNQAGYTGFGNNGSVFDFFRDNSGGLCRYTNVVAPYVRASRPKSYYTDPAVEQPVRARALITEALNQLRANGFDFSRLTTDRQGFVYALNVFYAGPVTNNWSEGLWPHSHYLATAQQLVPGKSAYDYQFTAMGSELTLGTFCHENGHMLCDYPDLYDYGSESSGVGLYCLMCAGNFNEKNPIPISAYLKRASGWASSVVPIEHDKTITLTAGSNEFAIYQRSGREYFLLENRQKSGRDAGLPDAGLAIWHIDEDGSNNHEQMRPDSHYELSLKQADGLLQLERLRDHLGDGGDLYEGSSARFADDTTPSSKWWSGVASNLTIDQVSANGPKMTFRCRIGGGTVTPPPGVRYVSSPKQAIPDNNATGISDTITVPESVSIAAIKVGLDITHPYRGDLRVTLTTPWGVVVELQPRGEGGNARNLKLTYDEAMLPALSTLRGKGTQGAWRLTVQDLAARDVGRLNSWGLDITAAAATAGPVELKEAPGTPIPDHPSPGIERSLSNAAAFPVGSVEVAVDISHSYIGDLRVSLVSAAGTVVPLHEQAGGSTRDLAKTYTVASTPALAALAGEAAAGKWRLRVVDVAAQDQGKLNSWRVILKP
ncbi:MAG: M6 family metalloprotease domain-containing protein [Betaproteobacteria bacterium]|jgi:M6 family metalloprotease-like protein|nr:M6 family metalloprotease domain-containing protein [Rhodocyclaceae bacterium]MCA3141058.1 M6 family metalloprotease domain-containing protein [Rhodocyclaceae bacterium]MCA3146146.1 M6 family metalloprotease domain-containing protein [Rhodocyclaceae bacterium]MCE2898309.1 M6 family metalloprotease domain-containing protein [Betaproteobacteria bacterium]